MVVIERREDERLPKQSVVKLFLRLLIIAIHADLQVLCDFLRNAGVEIIRALGPDGAIRRVRAGGDSFAVPSNWFTLPDGTFSSGGGVK